VVNSSANSDYDSLQVSVSRAVDSCVFQRNPGTGSMNPTLITDSGLAQPPVGQFSTSGRNVLRLNPLIELEPALRRQFALKERRKFKLQAPCLQFLNNKTATLLA
jgi:hypothetical protein